MARLTPEGAVKKECRAYLRSIGAYVFSPVQMGYGQATVDDLVCYKGRFIAIEYKRPEGGQLTKRQETCLESVSDAGGFPIVTSSVDYLKIAFDNFGLHRPL